MSDLSTAADTWATGRADDARRREDRALFARLDAGDAQARELLVERFLPLARSLAHRYANSGEPMDDLVQVASLALVKAIDRYDAAQGCAFTSYAVPTIVGELKRHFRDRTWIVRPPRRLQELTLRVQHAVTQMTQDLDRTPTVNELATALDTGVEQILEALQARSSRAALPFEPRDGADDDQPALQDTLGSCDDGYARAESRVVLDDLMGELSPDLREVLRLRFEQDLTQRQIGELLSVSQMQISRLIAQALTQMRRQVDQARQHELRAAPASA